MNGRIIMKNIFLIFMLGIFGFAGGAISESSGAHTPASAPHKIKALVLGCVDYRMAFDDLPNFAKQLGLVDEADLVTMPGASLAAVFKTNDPAINDLRPAFDDMVQFLRVVHGFDTVYVVDHRDCGMYKHVYKDNFASERVAETNQHKENMIKLKRKLDKLGLKSRYFLMDVNGTYEEIILP